MGRLETAGRRQAKGRSRRVLPVAVRPGEGPLTAPTAATQPWRRLPLFMPHRRHSLPRLRLSLSGMEADIRSRTICLAEVVPLVDFGDATPAVARIESSYHDL